MTPNPREVLGRLSQCVGRMEETLSEKELTRYAMKVHLGVLRELIITMGKSLSEQERLSLEKQLQDSLKMVAETGRARRKREKTR